MLGIRRLRGERGATWILAVGETGELALHRRHVGTTVTEPQHSLGEGLGDFCPVRAPKGWGRPDITRPGIDQRRELGGRGLDPGDPERERDWLAARLQHDPKGVSWSRCRACATMNETLTSSDLPGSAGRPATIFLFQRLPGIRLSSGASRWMSCGATRPISRT